MTESESYKTTNMYEPELSKDHLSEASETFLQVPPSFFLRGPIYVTLMIVIVAIVYSVIATVRTKSTGYLNVSGEEYLVQCPFSGTIAAVEISENQTVRSNQVLMKIISDEVNTSRFQLEELRERNERSLRQYIWLKTFDRRMRQTVTQYGDEEERFRIDSPPGHRIDILESKLKEMDDLMPDTTLSMGDFQIRFENLRKTLLRLRNEYQRTEEILDREHRIFKETEDLYGRGIITEQEYNAARNTLMARRSSMDQIVDTYKSEIYGMFQTISDTYRQIEELFLQTRNSIENLENAILGIDTQDRAFYVRAQYPGTVADLMVQPSQQIPRGMTIARIIRNDYPMTGITYVGSKDVVKVKHGQDVSIKLDAYPYQNYGVQQGKVIDVSSDVKEVPGMGYGYEVRIAMELTNPKIKLRFGMTGIAEITTGQRRLITLVVAPLEKFFKQFEE